jgi:hypothetical protein
MTKVPGANERLAGQISAFMQAIRSLKLGKTPGVAESIDWAMSLLALHADHLEGETVRETLGAIFKDRDDVSRMSGKPLDVILGSMDGLGTEELKSWTEGVSQRLERELSAR